MPDLLVCVEGDATDDDAVALREALTDLTLDGWTYRPELVDQVDAIPASRPDELAARRTVGMLLELPEPGETVDEHAVRRDLSRLVGAMSALARRGQLALVIEYRHEEVGFLDGSEEDDRFVESFFGE